MKMVRLSFERFEWFRDLSTGNYARERSLETGFSFDVCLAQALKEFAAAFFLGASTPGQFAWVLENSDGVYGGYIWYGIKENAGVRKVFVYDFMVDERMRHRGLGTFMMSWLEEQTKALGIGEISLHVLAGNLAAIALYESLGYAATNIYMAKKVSGAGSPPAP